MKMFKAELRSDERNVTWESRQFSLVLDRVRVALVDEWDRETPTTITFSVLEMEAKS